MVKKRLLLGFGVFLLALSVVLVVWQGSFNIGPFNPSNSPATTNPQQTLIFWAITILIFVLMVTLGFLLFRELVKLYVARQSNQTGSRIRTKLVLGALALSCTPVFCLVLFSFEVLSRSVDKWLTNPVDQQVTLFVEVASRLKAEMQDEVDAQAETLAVLPETRKLLTEGQKTDGFLQKFALARDAVYAGILPANGGPALDRWSAATPPADAGMVHARHVVKDGGKTLGYAELTSLIPLNVEERVNRIQGFAEQWIELRDGLKNLKVFYTLLMILITLFVLFVTTWIAFFLAKQISVPITALLDAAREVRQGNLKHRVEIRASDEMGSLVRGFNQMTQELESNSRELDRRNRFTEAILESIPTGVISIDADGSIKRLNRALSKILPAAALAHATRLEDLFSREDTAEIKYLMKRARRTGTASRQLELRTETRKLQLAVTVSALEEKLTSGFVIVLEDTSELLRVQKSEAWREVARRVAHEIKNPLTPIALSAERVARQVERVDMPLPARRIMLECTGTISRAVDSVKSLVDEFSRFARFPTAQPAPADLNRVVTGAIAVFKDRLDGISIQTSLASGLPPVNLDAEQFERVVVNLVDNAAEAMQDSLVKNLYIATQMGAAETVELVVADSGCGVGPDDKEKLFLPYFSTKNRGTGLGLAIVSHIVAEHNGTIRVEDNQPAGARFTVEIPALLDAEGAENGASPRPAAANV